MRVQILGVLNVTRDSFSDGGRYLTPEQAIAHGRRLVADGADIIDIGAEATNPDAEEVPADEEIRRLTPVVAALRQEGVRVSVDTCKPAVMRAMLDLGVEIINDVTGVRDPEAVAVLRHAQAAIIVMHSTATGPRAERADADPQTIVTRVLDFLRDRVEALEAAGIARRRLILDPGMGFFLGRDPQLSLEVLRHLDRLATLGRPLCVSVSRKSFIGATLGSAAQPRAVAERAAGTLAAELWAAQAGVQYIRTHDVRALRDALTIWQALHRPSAGALPADLPERPCGQ